MSFKQMLVIDFKAMTTQVTLRLFVLYALLLIGINAQAAGTCLADKSDISEDMRKINAKLDIKYSHSAFQNNAEREMQYLTKFTMNKN